jgi:hypothetical protein
VPLYFKVLRTLSSAHFPPGADIRTIRSSSRSTPMSPKRVAYRGQRMHTATMVWSRWYLFSHSTSQTYPRYILTLAVSGGLRLLSLRPHTSCPSTVLVPPSRLRCKLFTDSDIAVHCPVYLTHLALLSFGPGEGRLIHGTGRRTNSRFYL